MPRPRRKPRPPGSIRVICTGRGKHDPVRFRPPLQLRPSAGDPPVRVIWDSHWGTAPITAFHGADGQNTFEFMCRTCGRCWKRREDDLVTIALALAGHQGIEGDSRTPITIDVSRIERA